MLKTVVCLAVLFGVLELLGGALRGIFADYGMFAGAVACLSIMAWCLAWGAEQDRNEKRRSQSEQPPEPSDSRSFDL